MTPNDMPTPDDRDDANPGLDTGNPADFLPARTTPTWEIEILLSGASVFALFQLYGALQQGMTPLIERLSPEMAGLWSMLGTYVQAGVLGLAIGFGAHLAIRAFWAAAVGLHSIDPTGSLGRTETVGPAQRALLAARWARQPERIAQLDDTATIVFALSLGLSQVMLGLIAMVLVAMAIGFAVHVASGGAVPLTPLVMGVMGLPLLPLMVATAVDGHRGKKGQPPAPWTVPVIRAYSVIGMSADGNIGLQMMVHRLSSGRRSYRGTVALMLLMTLLMVGVGSTIVIDRVGMGTLMKGEFPRLQPGQDEALRSIHYLDRLPPDEVLNAPVLPSELSSGPYLRLFIPYVPHWHDETLAGCREASRPADAEEDWRLAPGASAAVLRCFAATIAVQLDGNAVETPWMFSDDRRHDRRGFVVMIDVRALPAGRHELAVQQPAAALDEGERDAPWRIPFWR
jgi:hypothetical protein